MISQKVDSNFEHWLDGLANDWGQPVSELTKTLGIDEIHNRLNYYPEVAKSISANPFDLSLLAEGLRKCWAMGGRFDSIRLNDFVTRGEDAKRAILTLVTDFPDDDVNAAKRIKAFVDKTLLLGFTPPNGRPSRSGAILLASVILTSVFPKRFVDFRQQRWIDYADLFSYEIPFPKGKNCEGLVWASHFAKALTGTQTFKIYWPAQEQAFWIISGLCWIGPLPEKCEPDPLDIDDISSFPEGAQKRRMHLFRERNRRVVMDAKAQGKADDRNLCCAVCGFSFVQFYGSIGTDFIEAHHTIPVAKLREGSRTKIEDIALVCANCHKMLHRGQNGECLSLSKLQDMVMSNQAHYQNWCSEKENKE